MVQKIKLGIFFYVSQWSTFYYKNAENDVYALASDDNTLKMIVANSIPDGQSRVLIDYLFNTPSQQKQLMIFMNKN